MTIILLSIASLACVRWGPSLLVHIVATLHAIALICRSRRHAVALLAADRVRSGWDRRPSRSERRLLANSFRAAVDVTCFTSLLPGEVLRAHRLVRLFR